MSAMFLIQLIVAFLSRALFLDHLFTLSRRNLFKNSYLTHMILYLSTAL